jgi:hypothetical protein
VTACCHTDTTVFGHVSADCPHTSLPPLDVAARAEHIAWLDRLAERRESQLAAEVTIGGSAVLHFRRLVRSRT